MQDINTIVVIATWSSGSTALTGFLNHCGAYTCPPHQRTNDGRTPNSFEPILYSEALRKLFDELTLKRKGNFEDFKFFFEKFYGDEVEKARISGHEAIVLKHPLQTFILPYLNHLLHPKYVFVTRPIEEIEATRVRRKWHPAYGAQGAKRIYPTAMNFLISNSCSYLSVPYNALIKKTNTRKALLDFCNLSPTNEMLRKANDFLNA